MQSCYRIYIIWTFYVLQSKQYLYFWLLFTLYIRFYHYFSNQLPRFSNKTYRTIYLIKLIMPLTKLWVGIKTCTFRLYIRPFIRTTRHRMCTTPHTPLMDFVHTHTQWPTWHGDDRKDGILRCCKFYMSYRTLSWGASVSYRHISS